VAATLFDHNSSRLININTNHSPWWGRW